MSLGEERLKYRPPLPDVLPCELQEGAFPEVRNAIKELLPKTSHQPLLHLKKGKAKEHKPLRVGVVLSGGQAPGGHNVICGLFDALIEMNPKSQLFGFLDGPSGIVQDQFVPLTKEGLAPYRNTGGFDLIGSGRTKIETPEQLEAARQHVEGLNLDGLVIIGGDDSNTNAALLAEYFVSHGCKTCVVGVPKTIDGDLKNAYVETSFGFDTATKTYSELIGNICRDAMSSKKYFHFIKLMGRSASHVALECALQTHPNVAIIGEEVAAKKLTLKQVAQQLAHVVRQRSYGVILIPEGLIEFVSDLKDIPGVTLDPHGNIEVSHIATEQILIDLVKEEGVDFHPVNHFFGYEGRSAYPSNFDATYCNALGLSAAMLVDAKRNGYMCFVQNLTQPVSAWKIGGLPITMLMDLEERKGKLKPVIQKALVDLEGRPFKAFAAARMAWSKKDAYRFPGPMQYFGPSQLTDTTTITLQLEHNENAYSTLTP